MELKYRAFLALSRIPGKQRFGVQSGFCGSSGGFLRLEWSLCCFKSEFALSSSCKWVKMVQQSFRALELVDKGSLQQNNSEKSGKGSFFGFNQQQLTFGRGF